MAVDGQRQIQVPLSVVSISAHDSTSIAIYILHHVQSLRTALLENCYKDGLVQLLIQALYQLESKMPIDAKLLTQIQSNIGFKTTHSISDVLNLIISKLIGLRVIDKEWVGRNLALRATGLLLKNGAGTIFDENSFVLSHKVELPHLMSTMQANIDSCIPHGKFDSSDIQAAKLWSVTSPDFLVKIAKTISVEALAPYAHFYSTIFAHAHDLIL